MPRSKIDVMEIPAADRHPAIFRAFDSLSLGDSIELKVDHDPRRLFSQFSAQRSGAFNWVYLEQGPDAWRIELTKTSATIQEEDAKEEGCCGCCGVR